MAGGLCGSAVFALLRRVFDRASRSLFRRNHIFDQNVPIKYGMLFGLQAEKPFACFPFVVMFRQYTKQPDFFLDTIEDNRIGSPPIPCRYALNRFSGFLEIDANRSTDWRFRRLYHCIP